MPTSEKNGFSDIRVWIFITFGEADIWKWRVHREWGRGGERRCGIATTGKDEEISRCERHKERQNAAILTVAHDLAMLILTDGERENILRSLLTLLSTERSHSLSSRQPKACQFQELQWINLAH
jgi:hypothetical protein